MALTAGKNGDMSKYMTTVLVVDDDPAFRQLLGRSLSQAGYYVLEARSASEAEHSLSFEPDLIVVDFRMPGMDGFDWITHLRDRGNQVPIAFCSGSKFDEQRLSILRSLLKVGLIIQKPIDAAETVEQIKRLMPPKLVQRPVQVAPKFAYLSALDGQPPVVSRPAPEPKNASLPTNATTNQPAEKNSSQAPSPGNLSKAPAGGYQYYYEYNPETKVTSTAYDLPALSPEAAKAAPYRGVNQEATAGSGEVELGAPQGEMGNLSFKSTAKQSDFIYTFEVEAPAELTAEESGRHKAAHAAAKPPAKSSVDEDSIAIDDEIKCLRDEYSYELPSILSLVNLNLLMASGGGDMELIWSAGACAHQVSGTAGSLGLTKISKLAGQLEQILDRIKPAEVLGGGEKMARALALTQEARGLADEIVKRLPPAPPKVTEIAPKSELGAGERPISGSFQLEAIGPDEPKPSPTLERILICSTDNNLIKEIEQVLASGDLFTLQTRQDELMIKLEEVKPDVILLDEQGSGDLSALVKLIKAKKPVRVIIMIRALEGRTKAFAAGADDFVLLPLLPFELGLRVGL
jgi:DNA-binding response OmpR family regulator